MERKVLLVCCAVGLLGLLSAATGFGAEVTRIKVNRKRLSGFCLDLLVLFSYGLVQICFLSAYTLI